jgi:tricorn protease
MVALTNEHAGSDGDIFSHVFTQLGLGPLVGKRTWGGVVATWPRHDLVDGTTTTQPEFAYEFRGRWLENHGVEPDVVVDPAPHEHIEGVDHQLSAAVRLAIAQLPAERARVTTDSAWLAAQRSRR